MKEVLFDDMEFNANISKEHIFITLEDALQYVEKNFLPKNGAKKAK